MAAAVRVFASYGAVTWRWCDVCDMNTSAETTTYALVGELIKPLSRIRYCPRCRLAQSTRLPR